MKENKKVFVAELGELLHTRTRQNVKDMLYIEENGEEYVIVNFNNGYSKRVCVSGDSCIAIMSDIYRVLG